MCAMTNTAVFFSSLISCSPNMLLRYCQSDFGMVTATPVTTGIGFGCKVHMRWISVLLLLLLLLLSSLSFHKGVFWGFLFAVICKWRNEFKYCGYSPCTDINKNFRSVKPANNCTLSLFHIDCVRSWCAEDSKKVNVTC